MEGNGDHRSPQSLEKATKPSMRSLMERLSGKNYTELLKQNDHNWDKYVRLASELLHGVVGANDDTRDWSKIMSSDDIVAAIREETGKMHGISVNVSSGQIAVIQNRNGVTLRQVSGSAEDVNETLLNFGATPTSIPDNFASLVDTNTFDKDALNSLLNYTAKPSVNPMQTGEMQLHDKKLNKQTQVTDFSEVLDSNFSSSASMEGNGDHRSPQSLEKATKPSMRSLMERLSGKNYTELLKQNDHNWDKYVRLASELLHGVVGANDDTRDWSKIMSSDDIVAAIREETGKMHGISVNVSSGQIAVIQNRNGVTLRQVSGPAEVVNETLLNFGATPTSIPDNFASLVDTNTFDKDLLNSLLNYTAKPSVNQIL